MSIFCCLSFFLLLAYNAPANAAATERDLQTLFLRFYTNNDVIPYIDEFLVNSSNLVNHIDKQKNTVIYIHGFTESVNSTSIKVIVNAYLQRGDHNVLVVDWSTVSRLNYLSVTWSVEEVGLRIASAIRSMLDAGLHQERIHIVAHSMGAHVAGVVGRNISPPLPRITGLDPAGPLFQITRSRLSPSDALFVDIIHTDAAFYGVYSECGTVDFWPNLGRRIQPGCPRTFKFLSTEDFCSHHRSWYFYAESLLHETAFLTAKCSSSNSDESSVVNIVPMGFAACPPSRGSYCLVTSDKSPFGLSEAGFTVA